MPKKNPNDFFVITHNIRSAFNVGSIFRTADAVGINKIYLCGYTPTPPDDKIKKVALGADDSVPFESFKGTASLIKRLKKQGVRIIALENNLEEDLALSEQSELKGIDYRKFKPQFPLALVLGNEVKGLSKAILKLADQIIYLPMTGKKESLNVSVAFGVASYHIAHSRYFGIK
jgi:tRNA G18 (ribose-2'-O)-methylase SpoU